MTGYLRYEVLPVHQAAGEQRRARAPRCQHWGCKRRATRCYVWRTLSMPASAFWYRCDDPAHQPEPVR